ncbi:MAG: hypothetical protein BGO11_04190, partial [Solirubrobacterales bacterium 70-9]
MYRKRWLRDRSTELEILEPVPDQLTGEAAHNRMSAILDAETDHALFSALRYQQGSAIAQAAIAEAPSLAAALDAAAGGGMHDPGDVGRSDALLGLVDAERRRYFTDGGRPLKARSEKSERLGLLRDDVAAAEAAVAELDRAADRSTRIEREMLELEEQIPEADRKIDAGVEALGAVEVLEQKVEAARHELELAEVALGDVDAKLETRVALVATAARAGSALAELSEGVADEESDLAGARGQVGEAERSLETADRARKAAEVAARAGREGLEVLELRYQRDDLRERRGRVEAAEAEVADAERFLAGLTVDQELVAELEEAQTRCAVTAAHAEAGQVRLEVEALKPFDLQLGTDCRRVEPGESTVAVVVVETVAVIDDIARVIVTGPQGGAEIESEVDLANAHLRGLLEAAQVDSVAAARDLLRERSRRESDRDNAGRRRVDALKDLEPAGLEAKLERAEQRLDERADGSEDLVSTPAAFEEARERVRQADGKLTEAREAEEEAKLGLREMQATLRVLEDRSIERRTRREAAEEQARLSKAELGAAREKVTDGALEARAAEAKDRVASGAAVLQKVKEDLGASDPATVRITLENDRKLKERLNADLSQRRVSAAEVGEQLRLGGLEGLSDRLAEAKAKLAELDREVASEDRLAAAAKHLHDLLAEKREVAQQTYVRPFAEKVNSYARIVFGPEVRVEVDHQDFSLAARTLDHTTVPFDSLSGGAREQLAVLARLACAALVSPASGAESRPGVPVIIDDALGYSDPSRLEKLGAAFDVAGKDCQVIVLTCEPGRYRGIGGAKVVSLAQ